MSPAAASRLRAGAEALAAPLPPLLAEAEHLAATVALGVHGRRRAGPGEEFWQYRAAHPGDSAHSIDWRRSARSDGQFVRQKEWQAAQSVWFWVDPGQSMDFASGRDLPTKAHRARVLALALAILLSRGGERVGLTGARPLAAAMGTAQIDRLASVLGDADAAPEDFAHPDLSAIRPHGRAVLISDFLADPAPLTEAVRAAAARGVRGILLQVLDPQEESFPFSGRTIFESMGRSLRHETLRADDLRSAYLARLAERRAALTELARRSGWRLHAARTDAPASAALLWAYQALEAGRA